MEKESNYIQQFISADTMTSERGFNKDVVCPLIINAN